MLNGLNQEEVMRLLSSSGGNSSQLQQIQSILQSQIRQGSGGYSRQRSSDKKSESDKKKEEKKESTPSTPAATAPATSPAAQPTSR